MNHKQLLGITKVATGIGLEDMFDKLRDKVKDVSRTAHPFYREFDALENVDPSKVKHPFLSKIFGKKERFQPVPPGMSNPTLKEWRDFGDGTHGYLPAGAHLRRFGIPEDRSAFYPMRSDPNGSLPNPGATRGIGKMNIKPTPLPDPPLR
jgi:hypothetical protein